VAPQDIELDDEKYAGGRPARTQAGHWDTLRTAKARLSELLERAAAGEEIVITSSGLPKARIVGLGAAAPPFRVNRRLLRATRKRPLRTAEALVREERDARD
jgi:antitoxin (DNA-binding transcriptional repressor) of toxin-antitoxin stability system